MVTNLVPRDRLDSLAKPLQDALGTADSLATESLDRAAETGKALLDTAADRVQAAARTIGYDWTPPKKARRRRAQKRSMMVGLTLLGLALVLVGVRQATQARKARAAAWPAPQPASPDGLSATNGQAHATPKTPAT